MPVGRHALRDTPGDNARRTEKRCCRCPVTLLTQPDVNAVPITIESTGQIGPAAFPFAGGFVDLPAPANSSPPMLAEGFA